MFISICFVSGLMAQDIEVSSSGQKLTNKISKFRLLGKVGSNYVVERYGSDKHIFDIYSSKLSYKASKEFLLEKNQTFHKTWLLPDGGWISFVEKEKDFAVLKTVQVDENFKIADKQQVLDTIYERPDLVTSNIRSKKSLNESHTVFYLPVFDNGDVDYFLVHVYDRKMNLVQTQKLSQEVIKESGFADLEVFNDGSFVAIFQQTDEKPEHSGDVSYALFYSSIEGDVQEYEYQPQDAVFKKPKFEIDNANNTLLIAGFYQYEYSKKKSIAADRFFSEQIDLQTGETTATTVEEFSDEFYFELTGNEEETEPKILYTFYVKEIIAKADGGMLVIAESFYKDQEESYNNSLFSSPTYSNYVPVEVYHYNDIVVYDIDDSGEIETPRLIYKRQTSQDDRGSYSSFYTMNGQDNLRLLYMSAIEQNATLDEFIYTPDEQNNPSTVFNVGAKDVFPIVKMSIQTAPNELIIPSFENNQVSIIRMTYSQ
ncbi:MAG: hypothetical protein ACPG4Z_03565 [Chitinophagales bacterium]